MPYSSAIEIDFEIMIRNFSYRNVLSCVVVLGREILLSFGSMTCELMKNSLHFDAGASILGVGGRDPPMFGWEVAGGVVGGSWTNFGKHYSVFCTESMLEDVFL